jgi:hypothetical protein
MTTPAQIAKETEKDIDVSVESVSSVETPLDLNGINRNKDIVTFRKEKAFIETFKCYMELLKFGSKFADMGLLDPGASVPVFSPNTNETLSAIRRRFSALTKQAIFKHPAFSMPEISYHHYDRKSSNHSLTNNINDFVNFGKFTIDVTIDSYIDNPLFHTTPQILALEHKNKYFEGIAKGLELIFYNLVSKEKKAKLNEMVAEVLSSNFEVVLLKADRTRNSIFNNTNGMFNGFYTSYCDTQFTHTPRFNLCLPEMISTRSKNGHEVYGVNRFNVDFRNFCDNNNFFYEMTETYFPELSTQEMRDKYYKKISIDYPTSNAVLDYHSGRFFFDILRNFSFDHTKELIALEPIRPTNYIFMDAIYRPEYLQTNPKSLVDTWVVLAQRRKEGDKFHIDLNRFLITGSTDFSLSQTVMQSPVRFIEAHNIFNDVVKGLVDA